MTLPRILAVITARGGSKGLPGKNVRDFMGKPLIAHTINAAKNMRHPLHKLIISTDDPEIAECCRQHGALVPFMRPAELAQDTTASLPVIQHATRFIEEQDGVQMDWVITLQPTSPLRLSSDLDDLVDVALREPGLTSAVTVYEAMDSHPLKLKKMEDGLIKPYIADAPKSMRRQDMKPIIYKTNGAGYITRRDTLFHKDCLIGDKCAPSIMPSERSIDIDTELDFVIAETIMQRGLK